MTADSERRPDHDQTEAPLHTQQMDDTIIDQLDRRRQAALRLPPLASGRRDPWRPSRSDGVA